MEGEKVDQRSVRSVSGNAGEKNRKQGNIYNHFIPILFTNNPLCTYHPYQSVSSVWYPACLIFPNVFLAALKSFSNLKISTCCSISLFLNSKLAMLL